MTLVEQLIACGALQFGDFTLTSGRKSPYYVDIKRAVTDPGILRDLAQAMAPAATGHARLAGVELGAIPLVVALSLETGLPYVMIRKASRTHGTGGAVEGDLQKGDRTLLVEDVTTTGGSVARGVDLLREAGAIVERVVCVVDREEGARDRLKSQGVELVALLTSRELLERAE